MWVTWSCGLGGCGVIWGFGFGQLVDLESARFLISGFGFVVGCADLGGISLCFYLEFG